MMLPLLLGRPEGSPVRALAIRRAHPDDVEIGCAGTIMKLIERSAISDGRWVVLSGEGERFHEARRRRRGAARAGAGQRGGVICDFLDGFFPYEGRRIKEFFEDLKVDFAPRRRLHPSAQRPASGSPPDLRADLEHLPRPPDPRVRGAQVRRRHGRSEHVRSPLRESRRRKIGHLMDHFASQRSKTGSGRICSRASCGCAAWSATRQAPTPRRSSAASPCSRDRESTGRPKALVTGASSGIGAATCRKLREQGWHVAGVARRRSDAANVSLELDITRLDDLERAFEAVPHLELLVHSAGTIRPVGPLLESDPDEWRRAVEVNLIGTYNVLRAGLAGGLASSGGRAIHITTGAAKTPPSPIGAPTRRRRRVRSTSSAPRRPTSVTTAARSAPSTRGSPKPRCRRRSASRLPRPRAFRSCSRGRHQPQPRGGRGGRLPSSPAASRRT